MLHDSASQELQVLCWSDNIACGDSYWNIIIPPGEEKSP
jgi:hypothetical protein